MFSFVTCVETDRANLKAQLYIIHYIIHKFYSLKLVFWLNKTSVDVIDSVMKVQ